MIRKNLYFFLISFALFLPAQAKAEKQIPAEQAVSAQGIQKSLLEVETLISNGDLLKAQHRCKLLLRHDLEKQNRKKIKKSLETVNMKILFSPIGTADSLFYTVAEGDSLGKIAKKYGTTVGLIKRTNHLKKDVIRPGMKLKIMKGKFSVQVDKSENKLQLFHDRELMKTYSVSTGANNSTPVGTFTIDNKLENPTWYATGAVVPPNSPENTLGTRWLGFSIPEYGIHGTIEPESIGKQASKGCVRMLNKDVEELFDIVPLKTTVKVVD